jgi:hypothetical protein
MPSLTLNAKGMNLVARIAGEISRVVTRNPGEDIHICSASGLILTIPAARAQDLARAWQKAQAQEEAGERVPATRGRAGSAIRRASRRQDRAGSGS